VKAAVEFRSELTKLEQREVLHVLDEAFASPIFSENTRNGFFRGFKSTHQNFVLVKLNSEVAGLAVIGKRKIRLLGFGIPAFTIGPLAVHPKFQNLGLGALLMEGIDTLATESKVSLSYLQGIPDFYSGFGYHPVLSRSKVVIQATEIFPQASVKVRRASKKDMPAIAGLFELNAQLFSCASVRTSADWDWLSRYGVSTYYFYQPTVIVADDRVVGYFCADAADPARIREACYGTTSADIRVFLSGLKDYATRSRVSHLELMTPQGSPLHEHLKAYGDGIYVERIQRDGGQLLRIRDCELLMRQLQPQLEKEDLVVTARETGSETLMRIGSKSQPDAPDQVAIPNPRLPGLMSGYLQAPTVVESSLVYKLHAIKCFELLSGQTPFVYQGDNY
jgi:predicted N-acetyltransferase YhbS